MQNERRQQLAQAVRERRKALDLTQAGVQARGGPSTATQRLIEKGADLDFRRGTIEPLEKVLGWQPGSMRAYLHGEVDVLPAIPEAVSVPPPVDDPPFPDVAEEAHRRASDSQILLAARRKVMDKKTLSSVERIAWLRHLEDVELETFWERWELLDRDQQLAISRQVSEMLEQEAEAWVAEYGDLYRKESHGETQQKSQQGARGAESGGAREQSGASIAAPDGAQHAGISGTGPDVPLTQDDVDLARYVGGPKLSQDQRDQQDQDALRGDPEGSDEGA